jgi:hypothetical protein
VSHYASLISDTAVRATVQWGIGFLTGALATGKLIRRHVKATTEIADSLNTATPGGLTDVLHAIQAGPAPEEHPRDAR